MQTFHTSPDPTNTGLVLDDVRLNCQIKEAGQILTVLNSTSIHVPWYNHPAVRMWRGYTSGLKFYHDCMLRVRIDVRKKSHVHKYFNETNPVFPPWFTDKNVIKSHKCSLLRKNIRHYSKLFPNIDPKEIDDYLWPALKSDKLGLEYLKNKPKRYRIMADMGDYLLTKIIR